MGRFFYSLLLIVTILLRTNESCGVLKATSENVMQREASSEEWPWQVYLKPDLGHICSGTIISEFWILTSANCFTDTTTTILMKVGELDLDFQGEVYPIKKLVRHHDYNENVLNKNIALLETWKPVTFNDTVLPACYPDDKLLDAELLVNCRVATTKESTQDGSDNTAKVPMLTQFTPIHCDFYDMTGVICAKQAVESSDCMVESGDALMCQHEMTKAWMVVGIASLEETACTTTVIFVRTASYITWIRENTAVEGKPIVPEMRSMDLIEPTTAEQTAVMFTKYYNEEPPATEYMSMEMRVNSKENKLQARKLVALFLFYTQAFLVLLTM